MATSPNFSWPEPDNTDLVKNGALAIRTAVDAIDASMVDLKGGTTGQVLSKATNTDMDFTWVAQDDSNAIQNAIVDAKGDIIAATADNTPARLAVGTANQVLTVDSSTATGLKWATPSGGGKVLQVVQGTLTSNFSTSSASYVDTGLSVTITPTSATSKIMVFASMPITYCVNGSGVPHNYALSNLVRTSTQLQEAVYGTYNYATSNNPNTYIPVTFSYLDSPATTSATTYKTQAKIGSCSSVGIDSSSTKINSIVVMEIGA